jgi:hypothetical protein
VSAPDLPGGGDPDLARLGQAFRDELRAEAEAYEELAAKDLLRRRSLTDVALELVHRGDRVAVTVGETALAGVVVYAAGDLACLRTSAGDVDLRLTAGPLIRVIERVRSGGQPNGRGPASFVARLHEHEAAGSEMVLGGPGVRGEVRGRLAAVAGDHVVVDEDGGGRAYVGLPAIAWARPLR